MKKSIYALSLVASALVGAGGFGLYDSMASDSHSSHDSHAVQTSMAAKPTPSEGGQAGFAAMAEIVEILNTNPNTDWSKVNISALRDHLVDMEFLTTEAEVEMTNDGDTTIFSITGAKRALEAAKRMVPAHSSELTNRLGWNISTEINGSVVKMIVMPSDDTSVAKIRGLGFFGIMATGSHHQPHHLGMAKGTMVH